MSDYQGKRFSASRISDPAKSGAARAPNAATAARDAPRAPIVRPPTKRTMPAPPPRTRRPLVPKDVYKRQAG